MVKMSEHTEETAGRQCTTEILLDLLIRTATAHGVHEAEVLGGVHDAEWPRWYAAYLADALAEGGYRLTGPTI